MENSGLQENLANYAQTLGNNFSSNQDSSFILTYGSSQEEAVMQAPGFEPELNLIRPLLYPIGRPACRLSNLDEWIEMTVFDAILELQIGPRSVCS